MSEITSVITDKALEYMENNTIDRINTSRRIESSILMEYYLDDIDFDTVYRNNLVPAGNRTQTSLGKSIRINSPDRLIMFPTTRRIYDNNEMSNQKLPIVESLVERGNKQYRSFMVYLNGVKIPDSKVFVYASTVGTDLFIPAKYFDTINPNRIVLTVRDYSNSKYNNYVSFTQLGNTISNIPYTLTSPMLTKKAVQVWINGLHVSESKFNITLNGNSFNVVFNPGVAPTEVYTVEVMVDKKIVNRYSENYVNSQNDLFVYLPETAPELKEHAIFMHMCDIYIDGLKISNQDLAQKTYRHILYKRSQPTHVGSYDTEIVITDKSQSETGFAEYLDDFMKFERWGSAGGDLRALGNDERPTDIINPPFVDYESMAFPPANKYIVDSNVTRMMTNEQRAIKMIEENAYYLKSLLTYYGIEEEEYSVTRNASIPTRENETVTILLDTDSEDSSNSKSRQLEIHINDNKIPNSYISEFSRWKTDNVSIPIQYFSSSGVDKVRLYKHPGQNLSQKQYRFNTTGETWMNTNTYKTVLDIANGSGDLGEYDIEDLKVFVIADKVADADTNYFLDIESVNVYYRIIENTPENYALRHQFNSVSGETELQIRIPSMSVIHAGQTVMLVNPRFHGTHTFSMASVDPNVRQRIILNDLSDGHLLPAIYGDYLVKVFASGKLLVPELDYFLITPETYSKVTCSMLVFRKVLTESDVVEIVYTGGRNVCLTNYELIPKTNKYGFIFFENLQIPFSLDYMDLYVNGRKLRDSDVVVYTDRLIRVKDEPLPFLNVVLYTRLSVAYSKFATYISEYMARLNDFDSYIKQFCSKVIFDAVLAGGNIPTGNIDINTIYETATTPAIDDSGKTPNPINPNPQYPIRFNPLINRLAVDYNADINKITKYFDANVKKPVNFDEYLMLVEEQWRLTHEIPFDANSAEVLSEDFIFDPNKYYRSREEIVMLLVEMMGGGYIADDIDASKTLADYTDPLLSNYLYPDDIVTLDSNIGLTSSTVDAVLDSNIIVDKP